MLQWEVPLAILRDRASGRRHKEVELLEEASQYKAQIYAVKPKNNSPWVFSTRFTLCIDENSKAPSWLLESLMWKVSSATNEAFASARLWLDQCHEPGTHKKCGPTSQDFVPSKLLQIPTNEVASIVKMVKTKDLGRVCWCSLSYCWDGLNQSKQRRQLFPRRRKDY
ncbi:hypothetical protein K469DRAFT_153388 [Zopfia rhizophila CBS 207.26]|uniref:Uncharacterized protein n=1 Tax=Zopfia rhizophila CBS 207.26 TaxID=1314779 RepID=A0A6A6E4T1_9PEZI|nr:hypothetical protein K469DRAFT_153388 [Zopfia rhizophila CBS 207.26]